MIGDEINLVKMYLVVKSREKKTVIETAVWVDRNIVKVLLDRGEITDANSVQFFVTAEEASKRWAYE